MMRKQTTSLQAYVHINISYKRLHYNTARRTQSEMVKISLDLPRASPRDAGDSTSSSSRMGSRRGGLGCGAGAGVAGGAALTGGGAMTRSNSSVVGRRRAVARMAGV